MNTYVFCPKLSQTALELCKSLGAKRLRRFDGVDFWNKKSRVSISKGDVIVCWGGSIPDLEDVRVLNTLPAPISREKELLMMLKAGINTPGLHNTLPQSLKDVVIPRKIPNKSGYDLVVIPSLPNYQFYKILFHEEYRVHSFNGTVIKAGIKVPREGFTPVVESEWEPNKNLLHPWVKTFATGWRVKYDDFKPTLPMRKAAHTAVKALGLTFGAVDMGEHLPGNFTILSVNRSPRVDGVLLTTYIKAINKWIAEEVEDDAGGA